MSALTIGTEAVGVNRYAEFNVTINDYTVGGARYDLQDLLVKLTSDRAAVVEAEVQPLSTRVRNRNAYLEKLGNALAHLNKLQARFDDDSEGSDTTSFSGSDTSAKNTLEVLNRLGYNFTYNAAQTYTWRKDVIEEYVQKVKTGIDTGNNEAQIDMNRLQSLVDRRDQSYTTATELMSAVSDTRAKTIDNM